MKTISASAAGKQIGLGVALVFSVTLATLLFNFLGTIACAALVGMMLGANRRWRWHIIFVSLVFPAVIAAFLQASKTDLTLKQEILLPIVCFGAFWLTYLLTCATLCFEKQDASVPGVPAAAQAVPAEKSEPGRAAKVRAVDPSSATPASVPVGLLCEPGLEELQGTWLRETSAPDGQPCRKVIEIVRDKFALSIVGSHGQVRFLSNGVVRLQSAGPFKMLNVSNPDRSAASAVPPDLPRTWIYRVAGSTLTVAANFEEAARGGAPTVESYVRTRDLAGAECLHASQSQGHPRAAGVNKQDSSAVKNCQDANGAEP